MKAAGGTGGVCRPREPRCQSSVSTSHSGTMNGVPAISIQLEPENRRLAVSGDAIASASYWILSTASPSLFAISTPRGRATSRWRVSAKLIDLTLRLPANRSTCFRYTRYHYVSNLNASFYSTIHSLPMRRNPHWIMATTFLPRILEKYREPCYSKAIN